MWPELVAGGGGGGVGGGGWWRGRGLDGGVGKCLVYDAMKKSE